MVKKTARAGTLVPLGYWRAADMMELSPIARDLHLRLLSYSADEVTDGQVPLAMVKSLIAASSDGEDGIKELRQAGLVQDQERVLFITDWHVFNLSHDEVEYLRTKRAAAGRRGGLSAAESRRQQSKPEAVA
jgi:hypothetical protein